MKKLLITVSAVILIVLLTPWIMGYLVENNLKRLIAYHKNFHLDIEVINYKRHWFSSEADLKISYTPSFAVSLSPFFLTGLSIHSETSHVQIWHGPIMLSRDSNHHLQINFGRALLKFQQVKSDKPARPDVAINGGELLVNYNGNVDSSLSAKINFKTGDGKITVVAPAANSQLHITSGFDKATGTISFPNIIKITDANGHLAQINDLTITFNKKRTEDNLRMINNQLHINQLLITIDNKNTVKMNNIDFIVDHNKQNNNILTTFKLIIQSANYNNQDYGPNVLEFHKKIDIEIYRILQDLDDRGEEYQQFTPWVLTKGYDVGVDKLQIHSKKGDLNAIASNTLAPTPGVSLSNPDLDAILARKTQQKVQINIDKLFLADLIRLYVQNKYPNGSSLPPARVSQLLQLQIDALIKNGFLVSRGNAYQLVLSFNPLNLNGKHIALYSELHQKWAQALEPIHSLDPAMPQG